MVSAPLRWHQPFGSLVGMDVTRTAFGAWSGGRFMHFGEALPEERLIALVQLAYERGVRTFLTADVYGNGGADEMIGKALAAFRRDTYCLVGAVGHDFYSGKREGSKGYPRFTSSVLRSTKEYAAYLSMATEKSLARCRTDKFDLLLLHNPDLTGYTSEAVWKGMDKLRESKLADKIGVAPGPANGFTLDLLVCFDRFGPLIDWAMIILNPLEPWPGSLVLSAAVHHNVSLITRVVDYGGLFHDDVRPGHKFGTQDHRAFRPAGWVEAGCEKLERMRPIAEKYGVTMLQLACLWNLSQPGVKSIVPTLIQETGTSARPIEDKLAELASLPDTALSAEDVETIREIGDNSGCMELKGANPTHTTAEQPDKWSMLQDHQLLAERWGIEPGKDLAYTHSAS